MGNPVENTMKDVVEAVLEAAGSDLDVTPVRTREKYGNVYEDIPRRVPSVDKAFSLLGWKPSTSMRDGVRKTVAWAKKNPWYLK